MRSNVRLIERLGERPLKRPLKRTVEPLRRTPCSMRGVVRGSLRQSSLLISPLFSPLLTLLFTLLCASACDAPQVSAPAGVPQKLAPAAPAIEALLSALTAREVSREHIQLGHYPLIHERGEGQALPLLSASAPLGMSPSEALKSLTPALLAVGYQFVGSERAWEPGRPLLAGVERAGEPAMILRLSPAGPRLTVLMTPPPPAEVPPRLLRRLPKHVTYLLDLSAVGALATYDYLSRDQRELILMSPAERWSPQEGERARPPLLDELDEPQNEGSHDQLQERWREELAELTRRPYLSGLSLPHEALAYQTAPHLTALFERLKALRVVLLEPPEGSPALATATARAAGLRLARPTHSLSLGSREQITAQLSAVEASLVLEGSALLWVPSLPEAQWHLVSEWLHELTLQKGVHLLRLSEVAL